MEEFKHTEKVAVKQRDIEKLQSSKRKKWSIEWSSNFRKHSDWGFSKFEALSSQRVISLKGWEDW